VKPEKSKEKMDKRIARLNKKPKKFVQERIDRLTERLQEFEEKGELEKVVKFQGWIDTLNSVKAKK